MRYVNSNDIPLYYPMDDFLEHLPKWDGKDRVEALARRVKTDYEDWPHLFLSGCVRWSPCGKVRAS